MIADEFEPSSCLGTSLVAFKIIVLMLGYGLLLLLGLRLYKTFSWLCKTA
jgi:hypothetical protein